MRDKWAELHYIDLFAGAGIARIKTTGELVYTSSLLAARVKYPFTQLHLCDREVNNTTALAKRLSSYSLPRTPKVYTGDANEKIQELLAAVPRRNALCMTFADPFGLHFDFTTAKAVAGLQSDLLILVADSMDALRNWAPYYLDNDKSPLDRFMGDRTWRDLLKSSSGDQQASRLRQMYRNNLETLGYAHFAEVRVQNSKDVDIYTLLYASKSKAGIKIWDGISKKDEGGQYQIDFKDS